MVIPYCEGSVFAVPLRTGGYALGVVARISSDKSGGLLGYFFGPKRDSLPPADLISALKADDALKVLRFGDLSLLNNEWPILGSVAGWSKELWPMPFFVRRDDLSKKAWRVLYSDGNICEVVKESPEPFDSKLERDAIFGSGAVELLLGRLLA
ncbi:immunity 26/phosphotriesterase HocA family protein [Chromobacterium alticapitis]|uniref:Immunity protein 26 n=1 Tax=Chromobacterium alticapitis TaxID=2073169 RepID=A0A2S5DAG9_9NEIS|nr:immunity 26/phosphotriesterase HocA family protein [Chromobacterium alticapitis]POZ60069.1 hypothetical protein C2I19_20885 [Chromobacterium alticapitis]